MKIISLHNKESQLIRKAIKQDREAQQLIFEMHSPKMLSVCRQYVKDLHHAEDLMLTGFLKVFTKLERFEKNGSFEAWIHRIMVNTCISHLRKNNPIDLVDDDTFFEDHTTENLETTGEKELQKLIDTLPTGYKMVFNLFAIEGFTHAEIAAQLHISESTSKSQLFKARKWLQKNYTKMNQQANGDK